jgi:hypothetical protein
MTKLIVKNETLPLKAFPKETLTTILEGEFAVWISNLLGLTGEDSAKRLLVALPAIEKHFWSLGFDEIQKAFIMYVDGELTTKPLSNFLDRALVGKIFHEYKEQKPRKQPKVKEISDESKFLYTQSGLMKCLNHFEKHKSVLDGYANFLYDILYEEYLPKDKEYKQKIYNDAKLVMQMELQEKKASSSKEFKVLKEALKEIEGSRSMKVIAKSKELIVLEFLFKLFKDQQLMKKLLTEYKIKKDEK